MMISSEENGMTSSCSNVPNSRSREKERAAKRSTVNSNIKPSSAGVVYSASLRASLNHTRRLGVKPAKSSGLRPRRRSAMCSPISLVTPPMDRRATVAGRLSAPLSKIARVGRPVDDVISLPKSGRMTTAALIRPRSRASWMVSRSGARALRAKVPVFSREVTTARLAAL